TTLLRATTHAFCTTLLTPPPPSTLLHTYFVPPTATTPSITEHGPSFSTPRLPFLHRTFTGAAGFEEYFSLMTSVLDMELPADAFPAARDFIVDADADAGRGMVCVVGKGRFRSRKTGRAWEERFVYRFGGFDEQGRIGWWEVWADPLSAWEAVG
ncbi:hypothetical protein CC80DRAFT_382759, partial [Byssothecium circinans]